MNFIKTLFLVTVTAVAASASTMTYTESVTTSGTLDGTGFSNQLVTITLTGDTSGIAGETLQGSTTVTVATVGSDTFTDSVIVFDFQLPGSGFSRAVIVDQSVGDLLGTFNPAFDSYDLKTPIGPLSGASEGNPGAAFPTAGGSLVLNGPFNVDHPATFTAMLAGTPEPATLSMLGVGIGLLAFGRRMIR